MACIFASHFRKRGEIGILPRPPPPPSSRRVSSSSFSATAFHALPRGLSDPLRQRRSRVDSSTDKSHTKRTTLNFLTCVLYMLPVCG